MKIKKLKGNQWGWVREWGVMPSGGRSGSLTAKAGSAVVAEPAPGTAEPEIVELAATKGRSSASASGAAPSACACGSRYSTACAELGMQ